MTSPQNPSEWSDPTAPSPPVPNPPAYPPPTPPPPPGYAPPDYAANPTVSYPTPPAQYSPTQYPPTDYSPPQYPPTQYAPEYPAQYPAAQYSPAPYSPSGYGQAAYGQVAAAPTNGLAVASLICSLVGLLTIISAPVGAVLGHVARRQIKQTGEQGDGLALAGIIVGWVITGLSVCGCAVYLGLFGLMLGSATVTSP